MKTIKQLIDNLTWYNSVEKLKEVFRRISDQPLASKIEAGSNVTLSGEGTEKSPLVINTSGGSEGTVPTLQEVVEQGNTITSGINSQGAPITVGGGGMDVQDSVRFYTGGTQVANFGATNQGMVITMQDTFPLRIVNSAGLYINNLQGISGTFASPTSITVTDGIITAIS